MKRYLIPIIAVMVLTSGLLIGCNQSQESTTALVDDEASWTEKQVIEYLYGYLMDKARPLQGEWDMIVIDLGFYNAISQANGETREEANVEDWGEFVKMEFNEPLGLTQEPLSTHTWTAALKRLVKYQGAGLWLVSIGDQEWWVNERTGEVTAQNEEAAQLLREISHQTYRHSIYGYHIDYPAVWTVKQIDDEGKILITAPEAQVDIAIDKPRKLQPGQSLGDSASGFAAFLSTVYQDFELISLVKLADGDYRMEYEWVVGRTEIYSRTYFVLHNNWFFMITGSAPQSNYESYMDEFDYAYDSFGFD